MLTTLFERLGYMPIIDHQREVFLMEREIVKLQKLLEEQKAATSAQRNLKETYKILAGKQWEGAK